MGTCLSRCYPETNTSTNGFSSSVKGNERTIKCEYRRIFRGHRNEDTKKWPFSTPKRHKYVSSEMPSHLCQPNHTDRSLPNVPIEPSIDSNAECNFVPLTRDDNSSLQRERKHLDSNGFNSHIIFASGDTNIVKSSVESPKNGYFISEANKNKTINELFEKYFEPEQDCILADGVEKFCADLCLPPDDFRVLLLAWHFEAETMCRFTRKEFCRGFKKLKVDSLQGLRSKIFAGCSCKKCASAHLMSKSESNSDKVDLEKDEKGNDDSDDQLYGRIYPSHEDGPFVTDITSNREAFKNMYKWSYRFALDLETGQRTLPLDMAMSMWQLVFSKRLAFFESNFGHPDVDEMKSFSVSQESFSCSISIHKSCEDTVKWSEAEKEISRELPDETSHDHFDPSCRDMKCQPPSEMDIILDNIHHALPLVRSWFQFLFSLKGSLRGITRDTWDMFFTFLESVGEDGSGYNDAEAWPSLFDDFIEWLKDKNHN